MIISHQHRAIFFAVPKTGTHSVRFALRPFLGRDDEEHVNLFKQSRLHNAEFFKRTDGHISVREIRPHLSDEVWNTYFKFCFVRNPWDRFVSTVFFRKKNLNGITESPQTLMTRIADSELHQPTLFYRPQSSFVLDDTNNIAVDFIGRTESMQKDFSTICKRLGLPDVLLERRNTSRHDNYATYYSAELKKRVEQLYQLDIELFNYSFGG